MFRIAMVFMASLLFSSLALADHDHGHHGHHGHHRHHGHHHDYQHYRPVTRYVPVERVYYRDEVRYYPERVVQYQPAPRYQSYDYDRRSPSGLIGGALGSVMGYELGQGDPLAAGFGAAAGSWLGNGYR